MNNVNNSDKWSQKVKADNSSAIIANDFLSNLREKACVAGFAISAIMIDKENCDG